MPEGEKPSQASKNLKILIGRPYLRIAGQIMLAISMININMLSDINLTNINKNKIWVLLK